MKRSKFRIFACLLAGLTISFPVFLPIPTWSEEDPAAAINPAPAFSRRLREPEVSFPTAVPLTAPVTTPSNADIEEPEDDTDPGFRPPYEQELMRLAEILGAVHYLRALCGADEGQMWRLQMEALIEAEEPGRQWHTQLTEDFNRGYRNFERSYRQCTPSAVLATRRYMNEGAELALLTQNRYAN
ncbi:MAG: TIGR02301 family protein [Rhizobiales bacterium]|nr:TIGR02301 family protein [Hyphomicrobiales bacterium]